MSSLSDKLEAIADEFETLLNELRAKNRAGVPWMLPAFERGGALVADAFDSGAFQEAEFVGWKSAVTLQAKRPGARFSHVYLFQDAILWWRNHPAGSPVEIPKEWSRKNIGQIAEEGFALMIALMRYEAKQLTVWHTAAWFEENTRVSPDDLRNARRRGKRIRVKNEGAKRLEYHFNDVAQAFPRKIKTAVNSDH